MRRLLLLTAVFLLGLPLLAQPTNGIKPRSKPENYPSVNKQPKLTLGAAQLSEKQVRRTFVSSLGKDYIVVEVGAFPNAALQLSPQDFMLIPHNQSNAIRPADPDAIAQRLGKKESSSNDVSASPVVGVTYSTGSDPLDPYSRRGWSTMTGVAVQKGSKRDPSTVDADRKTMATELKDKQFPAADTSKPVAGYLYFPAPDQKVTEFDLEYQGPTQTVRIPLTGSE